MSLFKKAYCNPGVIQPIQICNGQEQYAIATLLLRKGMKGLVEKILVKKILRTRVLKVIFVDL